MIDIQNLEFSFKDNQVLKNCSLQVNKGEVFGLVGVNGIGKSTLLRCLSGVYRPDGGTILVDNQPVFDNPSVLKEIFFISDLFYFPVGSTIKDIKVSYQALYDFDEQRYERYLQMFNLAPDIPIHRFSKGMKRQVFIIMALSVAAKVLVLDESFDGLDPTNRLLFKQALIERLEQQELSIIVSSQNLRELEDICDSFGILDQGKIVRSGQLENTKENVKKYQLAFKKLPDLNALAELNIHQTIQKGRFLELVIEGDQNHIMSLLEKLDPMLIDVFDVSFEELFLIEMNKKGVL